jgi:hypothetical protein
MMQAASQAEAEGLRAALERQAAAGEGERRQLLEAAEERDALQQVRSWRQGGLPRLHSAFRHVSFLSFRTRLFALQAQGLQPSIYWLAPPPPSLEANPGHMSLLLVISKAQPAPCLPMLLQALAARDAALEKKESFAAGLQAALEARDAELAAAAAQAAALTQQV